MRFLLLSVTEQGLSRRNRALHEQSTELPLDSRHAADDGGGCVLLLPVVRLRSPV